MAEIDGRPVGIGVLVPQGSELRACYVTPSETRRGVGSALVAEIERIAREHGLTYLRLASSVTAEPFYLRLGYHVEARSDHVLRSGTRMAAVKMRKDLG
jgi:putative acetyltransferase